MKRAWVIAAAAAFGATAAVAQAPGQGKGPGWAFNADNTRGWSMMSRQERTEHRNKMLAMKTYEECIAYLQEHRKLMETRAKERGRPGPAAPAQDMCERMRQAGRIS